jgi:carbohydrate-selective porin OprB
MYLSDLSVCACQDRAHSKFLPNAQPLESAHRIRGLSFGTLRDDQGAIDVYYRVQVTPQIAMSPTVQMVIDPVRNQSEDVVWVFGLRTRFNF